MNAQPVEISAPLLSPPPGSGDQWLTRGDGIDALTRSPQSLPAPGPGEVVIRVGAVSLNYRDLLVINGVGGWAPAGPVVPVSDAVGTVVATGADVTRFTVGDRILPAYLPFWQSGPLSEDVYVLPVGGPINRGFLSTHALVHEDQAVLAPASLTDEQAATIPVAGVTAWHSLERTGVGAQDTVLIHGTGGVALFALQLALARGARTIITSSDPVKLDRAIHLGAHAGINYRQGNVSAEVRRITDGQGASVVIDTVGGSNLNLSLDASALGARIAFVGMIGGLSAEVDTYRLVQKHVTLHGIETGSRDMLADLVTFIDHHKIVPVIDQTHAVENVQEALRALEKAAHFGKIVVTLPAASSDADA